MTRVFPIQKEDNFLETKKKTSEKFSAMSGVSCKIFSFALFKTQITFIIVTFEQVF